MRREKEQRQAKLLDILGREPFLTDQELARRLKVSVPTIRLDRLSLGVPQARERALREAQTLRQMVRSLSEGEVIGELVRLQLEEFGESRLATQSGMAFQRTGIVRGHFLFAQANSLAVALVDAPMALTVSARVRFLRAVHAGEVVEARARVVRRNGPRRSVRVESRVRAENGGASPGALLQASQGSAALAGSQSDSLRESDSLRDKVVMVGFFVVQGFPGEA